ncbi:MAG: amino acid permease [Clostridiales bacterium]|jgi:AAT family amino acid transporter|nr:amino acid permease [Clostridiales bacterium]
MKETGLSPWGLTMMALGTVIGGSFFLGSSIAIKAAGPSVLFAYVLGGVLVYLILFALSEMTTADPTPGSFRTYSQRAFGSGVGFVVGWLYWTGLVLAMSSEAIAVSVFLRTWFPQFSVYFLGASIIVLVTIANLLGADRLSKLESTLASVKLFAIIGFIVTAVILIFGILPAKPPIGLGALNTSDFFPGGIGGIAGSMLMVMFSYAGFEIIGLAASEARNPQKTIPRAISYTVVSLVGLYVAAIALILPMVSSQSLSEENSPFVEALTGQGIGWAANVVNIVLVTAILSTMLASMFGLGRMMRSLAEEGHAPFWIKDKGDVPFKGILFSGAAMLSGLFLGLLLPKQVYLFLVSSGGFSLLFTYLVIVATHFRFRKTHGCPPTGNCQMKGYPFASWFAMISLLIIIISMPLIPGQGAGLMAGLILLVFYSVCYLLSQHVKKRFRRTGLAKR